MQRILRRIQRYQRAKNGFPCRARRIRSCRLGVKLSANYMHREDGSSNPPSFPSQARRIAHDTLYAASPSFHPSILCIRPDRPSTLLQNDTDVNPSNPRPSPIQSIPHTHTHPILPPPPPSHPKLPYQASNRHTRVISPEAQVASIKHMAG
jgi:hypothetical protein